MEFYKFFDFSLEIAPHFPEQGFGERRRTNNTVAEEFRLKFLNEHFAAGQHGQYVGLLPLQIRLKLQSFRYYLI